MSASKILEHSINEKPGSKPRKRECPSKEKSANVARAPIWSLSKHGRDNYQCPSDSKNSQEYGPPRHEPWADRSKPERGNREENETSETDKEKHMAHRIMDLVMRDTFNVAEPLIIRSK
jgi:hypothetical protein